MIIGTLLLFFFNDTSLFLFLSLYLLIVFVVFTISLVRETRLLRAGRRGATKVVIIGIVVSGSNGVFLVVGLVVMPVPVPQCQNVTSIIFSAFKELTDVLHILRVLLLNVALLVVLLLRTEWCPNHGCARLADQAIGLLVQSQPDGQLPVSEHVLLGLRSGLLEHIPGCSRLIWLIVSFQYIHDLLLGYPDGLLDVIGLGRRLLLLGCEVVLSVFFFLLADVLNHGTMPILLLLLVFLVLLLPL